MKIKLTRRRVLASAAVTILAAGSASAAFRFRPIPEGLDLSLQRTTDGGLYVVTMEPGIDPVRIGEMHSWTVTITEPGKEPVDGAGISIDGGMPRHGNGLPTKPRVTRGLGSGSYRIDGMKFNMPGWWTLELVVDGARGSDSVTFNLSL